MDDVLPVVVNSYVGGMLRVWVDFDIHERRIVYVTQSTGYVPVCKVGVMRVEFSTAASFQRPISEDELCFVVTIYVVCLMKSILQIIVLPGCL